MKSSVTMHQLMVYAFALWERVKKHSWALFFACLVGVIYVLPHIIFTSSLGDAYLGIPIMGTANEEYYLGRIHEILDGHPLVGSFSFLEYKTALPLTVPTGEFLFALPSLLLGLSPVTVLQIARFVLPFILFMLVYILVHELCKYRADSLATSTALLTGLSVTLGYDVVNYRRIFAFLAGDQTLAESFFIWSRPVHPILGAILLFACILCFWHIVSHSRYRKPAIFFAVIMFALAIPTYFFSWGMILSILAILLCMCAVQKRFMAMRDLLYVFGAAFLLNVPYWILAWHAWQDSAYAESILRSGLFYTHYPLLNKFVFFTIGIYVIFALYTFLSRKHCEAECEYSMSSYNFGLALALGVLFAFSQQILTGVTIWPDHFVQYAIPLNMVALLTLFYNKVGTHFPKMWRNTVTILMILTFVYGVWSQVVVYRNLYPFAHELQNSAPLFTWLNGEHPECVVLTLEEEPAKWNLNGLVPAFTHCNIYVDNGISILMPFERIYHGYLMSLRLSGVTPSTISSYMAGHEGELRAYLFSNWKGAYNYTKFPDVHDDLLAERIRSLPSDYADFYAKDIVAMLKKYALDFIVVKGSEEFDANVHRIVPQLRRVFETGQVHVYAL